MCSAYLCVLKSILIGVNLKSNLIWHRILKYLLCTLELSGYRDFGMGCFWLNGEFSGVLLGLDQIEIYNRNVHRN